MDRTRNAVNRILLLSVGSVLLAAGTAVLAGATVGKNRLPHWWAASTAHSPWIDPQTWAAAHTQKGWSAGLTALLLLVSLSAAALILIQLRRRALGRLPLTSAGTALDARALTDAVTSRLQALPGVTSVRTTLHGTPGNPHLRTRLVLDDTASPRQLLTAMTGAIMPEARSFLTPRTLAAEARFTVRRHHQRRVR